MRLNLDAPPVFSFERTVHSHGWCRLLPFRVDETVPCLEGVVARPEPEGLAMHGIPFAQLSEGEKLRVSVGMGLAMNTELKVLLVRDGCKLDDDNRQMIEDMATAAGAQVWIEVIEAGEGAAINIEDGSIKPQEDTP